MDAIVAVYDDWGIGYNGEQPLVLHEDRKYFNTMTKDSIVIMGRKTFESFPNRKPLPDRVNIVISRDARPDLEDLGVIVKDSIIKAVNRALELSECGKKRVFLIGGSTIYKQALALCERVYVTKIHANPKSDVWFCDLDNTLGWELELVSPEFEENGITCDICVYKNMLNTKERLLLLNANKEVLETKQT